MTKAYGFLYWSFCLSRCGAPCWEKASHNVFQDIIIKLCKIFRGSYSFPWKEDTSLLDLQCEGEEVKGHTFYTLRNDLSIEPDDVTKNPDYQNLPLD